MGSRRWIRQRIEHNGGTSIELILNVNGSGQADIKTGIGFFDHMLTAFAQHSQSDLIVRCTGDLMSMGITVEDVGIC